MFLFVFAFVGFARGCLCLIELGDGVTSTDFCETALACGGVPHRPRSPVTGSLYGRG